MKFHGIRDEFHGVIEVRAAKDRVVAKFIGAMVKYEEVIAAMAKLEEAIIVWVKAMTAEFRRAITAKDGAKAVIERTIIVLEEVMDMEFRGHSTCESNRMC